MPRIRLRFRRIRNAFDNAHAVASADQDMELDDAALFVLNARDDGGVLTAYHVHVDHGAAKRGAGDHRCCHSARILSVSLVSTRAARAAARAWAIFGSAAISSQLSDCTAFMSVIACMDSVLCRLSCSARTRTRICCGIGASLRGRAWKYSMIAMKRARRASLVAGGVCSRVLRSAARRGGVVVMVIAAPPGSQ